MGCVSGWLGKIRDFRYAKLILFCIVYFRVRRRGKNDRNHGRFECVLALRCLYLAPDFPNTMCHTCLVPCITLDYRSELRRIGGTKASSAHVHHFVLAENYSFCVILQQCNQIRTNLYGDMQTHLNKTKPSHFFYLPS